MAVGRRRALAGVAVATLCVLAGCLAVVALPATASVQEGTVVGRPVLELFAPDNRVVGGEPVTLEVFVSNSGVLTSGGPAQFEERVKTARNVRFSVDTDRLPPAVADNVEVLSGEVPAGTVPEGVAGPFALRLEVNESIPPGTYELPIRLEYDYTSTVQYSDFDEPRFVDLSRTERTSLTLVVRDRPRFELATDGRVVTAGETAIQQFTVTNVGSEPATEGVLLLSASNGSITFGARERGRSTERVALARLDPGESRTVPVRVGAPDDLPPGAYPVSATVLYRSNTGVRERSPGLTVSVPVGAEQTFAVADVSDTLRVGDRGVVRGRLVNTGGRTVTNAVVVFTTNATGVRARQPEYAVGDLGPGESAPFEFVVDVANGSTAGPRLFDVRVRYRNPGDDLRVSDAVDAPVTVAAEQTFAVRDVGGDLQVSGTGRLTGTVVNTGDERVTDAVVVFEGSGSGLAPRETQYPVGDLGAGESATFGFPVDVPESADPGPQFVGFRVRYRGQGDERRVSDPLDARVRVGREQSFRLVDVESDLRVGERGRLTARLVNMGGGPAEDVTLLYAANGSLQPLSPAAATGTLPAGAGATVSFTFDVPRSADSGSRPLTFRARYRGADGDLRTSDPLVARVEVAPEQTFALRDVTSTLRVDDTGRVTGTLVNTGAVPANGVVLEVEPTAETLIPREGAYAVGSIAPGEAANVSFRFDVTADAESGPRLVQFRVSYRGQANERQVTDPIDARVMVAPERDEFAVDSGNATLPAGGSTVVSLRVESREETPLRNVRARLFVDDPLSSDDAEAFVPVLGPNETATIRFAVTAERGAVPNRYPLLVDFTYEDADGDTVLSDTYFVPVTVTEPRGGRLPFGLGALAAAGFVAIGVAVWKRDVLVAVIDRLRS